ncbi:MAG: glycosyltransferase family 4 protein [Bacteroidota bacterium]
MKVLHIIDTLGPGGAQILLKDLFENQKLNPNIYLFCLRKTKLINNIEHHNIFVFNSHSKYSFKPLFTIKKEIEKYEIDILHCHLFRSQVFGYLIKLFFHSKLKLIFHEHGQILGSETGSKIEDLIFKNFLRFVKRRVDSFIAVSQKVHISLKNKTKITENKIKTLYNFINLKQINLKIQSIEQRQDLLMKNTPFVLGFAGRIIMGKGWKDLLNSINFIENKNLKILIAGTGEESKSLIAEIDKRKISEKVKYLGYVHDMHTDFYPNIDCLIIPSHKEALGIVALEAFAHNKPVIASNIDGLNEIVIHNKNGLLFKVKDVKDLSQKIQMLLNDKGLREKLMLQATEDVKMFDIIQYLNELEKLYKKL